MKKNSLFIVVGVSFFISGCLTFFGIKNDNKQLLTEISNVPQIRTNSKVSSVFQNIPTLVKMQNFAEIATASDMGYGGLVQIVGTFEYKKIVERIVDDVMVNHFRQPIDDEYPILTIEINPSFFSVKKDGERCKAKFSLTISSVKQDALTSSTIIKKNYTALKESEWVDGFVPSAVYMALNEIFDNFLEELSMLNINNEQEGYQDSKTGPKVMPKLKVLKFNKKTTNGVEGVCEVECNGVEPFKACSWAKSHIMTQCSTHLSTEKGRLRIFYDNENTHFNEEKQLWTFKFSCRVRTLLSMDYSDMTRHGSVTVDLGLFNGTVTEATDLVTEFIKEQMDLRSGVVSTGKTISTANIRFGSIETDEVENVMVFKFNIVL